MPGVIDVSSSSSDFRPDVEGLRGFAVLLVVMFHAGFVAPGGFIGVDVFFVISGFLITGLLLRELEETAGIGLSRFYARRVRRLLPAAAVVLVACLAATWILVDPLDRIDAELDGGAAALSIANVRFALNAGDYFAAVAAPSPFLHFWSLGVEEQFYLVWPALLLVAARLARPRLGAAVALTAVFAASLAGAIVLSDVAVNWAFYALPTRAFELAAGGLLAVAQGSPRRVARWVADPVRLLAGLVGGGAILWAAVTFDSSLAYPGAYALVPTLGAAALIVSGRRGPAGWVLTRPPLRWLGRVSYSLYLWHWPILVLAPLALGSALDTPQTVACIALAGVAAALSWRLIEEPFRRGFRVTASRPTTVHSGRTVLAGLTALALIAVTSGTLAARTTDQLAALTSAGSTAAPDPTASPWGTPRSTPAPTRKPTPKPTPMSTPTPTQRSTPKPTQPPVIALPADVRPPLLDARNDREILWSDHCLGFEPATVPPSGCAFGDRAGAFTIAFVGDSHASALFPAVDRVARHHGARLVPFLKVACPFIDMRIRDPILKREYTECQTWNEAVIGRLRTLRPDLTLVMMSHWIYPVSVGDADASQMGRAVARMLEQIPGRVVLIADTPHAGVDVPACLSAHLSDIRACATPRAIAFSGHRAIERVAAAAASLPLVDPASAVCSQDPCPAVVHDMIVFRDSHHLTATFAATMWTALDRRIGRFLPAAG